jgi:hypothetical protein
MHTLTLTLSVGQLKRVVDLLDVFAEEEGAQAQTRGRKRTKATQHLVATVPVFVDDAGAHVVGPEIFVGDALTPMGGTTTVALPGILTGGAVGSGAFPADGAPGSLAHAAKQAAFSLEDAVEATKSLADTKGLVAATALLAAFGVERVRDLPSENRADYITQAVAAKAAV